MAASRSEEETSKLGQVSWALFDWANQPFFTLVTPGPTFHTIPEASDPPMWKSVGSSKRPCTSHTFTGMPRAAQTLL